MQNFINNILNNPFFIAVWPFLFLVIKVVVAIFVIMMCVAYATWLERKIHGRIHIRKGPNVVGPFGLAQPLFDGVKLLLKEIIFPKEANKVIFILAPLISFTAAIAAWAVIPINQNWVFSDINIGVLYLIITSSLGIYGIIMAGWASGSQYSLLGAIRSVAQMVSYELPMGLIIVTVVLAVNSFNLSNIVLAQKDMWFIIKFLPLGVLFFIITLAETNRHPFDLPESESDLVAGYHVEYSGFAFALFFLGEYANMMLMCSLTTILFLGGWLAPFNLAVFSYVPGVVWFVLKVIILLSLMISIRSLLPRYRYDQLMKLCWKFFLPLTFCIFIFVVFIYRFVG